MMNTLGPPEVPNLDKDEDVKPFGMIAVFALGNVELEVRVDRSRWYEV